MDRMGPDGGARGGLSAGGFGEAGVAEAVEDDFVVVDLEAGRGHGLDAVETGLELEDALACAADEVVVMALVGAFVTGGLAGDLDGNDMAFGGEGLEGAVDSGEAEAGNFLEGKLMDLDRGERVEVLV